MSTLPYVYCVGDCVTCRNHLPYTSITPTWRSLKSQINQKLLAKLDRQDLGTLLPSPPPTLPLILGCVYLYISGMAPSWYAGQKCTDMGHFKGALIYIFRETETGNTQAGTEL